MMTAETPQTLDQVAGYFRHARGQQSDEDWARSVAARLVLDDVRAPLIREALFELVPVLEDAQEPAETLFGDATAWAKEQQANWRSDGVPAGAPSSPRSVREFVRGTLVGAAIATPVFTFLRMFAEGWTLDFTVSLVFFPLILAAGVLGFMVSWNWLNRRWARGPAIALNALALIGFSTAVAILLGLTDELLWRGSGLWMLAVTACYALLAVVIGWIWPAPDPAVPGDPDEPGPVVEDDDTWKRHLAASLRERGDITESRLKAIIADAESHSAQSQRSLPEEFGSPSSYAARFATDESVRARRAAWATTALTVAPLVVAALYLFDDGWHWQGRFVLLAVWFAGAATLTISNWRRASGHRTG